MNKKDMGIGIWIISVDKKPCAIVCSDISMRNEGMALSKYRALNKDNFDKVKKAEAWRVICPALGCSTFATELLIDEELVGVPKEWWFVGDVERDNNNVVETLSVCPMCQKHARRFRKSLSERIYRIEERIDVLESEGDESKMNLFMIETRVDALEVKAAEED